MYARDYRAAARAALRGKWKKMALLMLLVMLLGAGAAGSGSGVSFSASDVEPFLEGNISAEAMRAVGVMASAGALLSAWTFFMGSFVRVGMMRMLNQTLEGEMPRAGMLFPKGIYWKSIGLAFMKSLFVGLWSMLFVIPGIIAAYRYAMADYILAMKPEIGVMDAIAESKARMVGRKWRMFCLELSFIGWELLSFVPLWLTGMGIGAFVAFDGGTAPFSAPAVMAVGIGVLISFIAYLFVYAYLNTALVAFFRDADRGGQWRSEAEAGEDYARQAYADPAGSEAWSAPMNSAHGQTAPVEPLLTADETVARDVFISHKCSHSVMDREGVLAEYLLLKASPISEARWKREYADGLMRRFDQDVSALDDLLSLAAENGWTELADRMLSRIERHLRHQSLPAGDVLNMCGRVLALLVSGAFDEDAGFVSRKKAQIADMADRLELLLRAQAPEGEWRQDLNLIRRLCD